MQIQQLAGAYGFTAGLTAFLSHPTLAEVLVDDGRAYLIRERREPQMGIRKRIGL